MSSIPPQDLSLILPGLVPLWEDAEKVLGHPAKNTWTFKSAQVLLGVQTPQLSIGAPDHIKISWLINQVTFLKAAVRFTGKAKVEGGFAH